MRAVQVHKFGPPEVMKVETDVRIPQPSSKQVLIKIRAAGINPVDTYVRNGAYANLPTLPYTPGKDAAGTIEEVGADVTRFNPGDRVYTCKIPLKNSDVAPSNVGTYGEYTIADEREAFLLPSQLDFRQGAALGVPYFTAYRALFQRANCRPGQTILVHGASGAVGLAILQLGKQKNLTVWGTAGSADGLDLIKREGAQQVFNHREQGYTDKIREATGGQGVDVIIEMLANVNLQKDLELLAYGGTVMVIGCRGNIEISPRLTMGKECTIAGMGLMHSTEADRSEQANAVQAGIEGGFIKPVVYKEYPLEEVAQAHHDIIETKSALGRMVLIL